jgi:alanine dehydrogenase
MAMKAVKTLLLKKSEVAKLLTLEDCIAAVEKAFVMHAEGKASPPGILGIHASGGGFHIKAGILKLSRPYFVAKTNANFPGNPKAFGLPTIQGVIAVSDAENGMLLALLDSMELTIMRTGAATAVAAKYLSKENSKTLTIVGCGNQGMISLRMLKKVRPIETVYAYDIDESKAKKLVKELSRELGIKGVVTTNLSDAVKQSDICVTCTTSQKPVLKAEDIPAGIFIAAVGADSENKQELESLILTKSKVVCDLVEQCAHIGELHHAIEQGLMKREDIHAELGHVIVEFKPGRTSPDEVIIFDSTGMALQDVASAAIVYENAIKQRVGSEIAFAE